MALEKKLIGQASAEQIEQWKKGNKNGIYAVEVGGNVGYFREPTRQDCNIAASQLDEDNPFDYFELIMRETFLGGSPDLIDVDRLYLGALRMVKKKIDGQKAKLVNL